MTTQKQASTRAVRSVTWEPCPGSAHKGGLEALEESCPICLPYWGKVPRVRGLVGPVFIVGNLAYKSQKMAEEACHLDGPGPVRVVIHPKRAEVSQ